MRITKNVSSLLSLVACMTLSAKFWNFIALQKFLASSHVQIATTLLMYKWSICMLMESFFLHWKTRDTPSSAHSLVQSCERERVQINSRNLIKVPELGFWEREKKIFDKREI